MREFPFRNGDWLKTDSFDGAGFRTRKRNLGKRAGCSERRLVERQWSEIACMETRRIGISYVFSQYALSRLRPI